MIVKCFLVASFLVAWTFCHAQPRLEPGEAEASVRSTTQPLITEFTSPAAEVRGVWLASRDMAGSDAQLMGQLDLIRAGHFNSVLIDTCFRGYVAYPNSEVLPHFPAFNGRDVLKLLVEEAHKRGLRAELWMEFGFYSYFTADATKDKSMGAILDAHPELLSVDAKGTRFIHRSFGDFYSICPSNPKSHEILARVYAEAASRYPVDGVNLDRIRYADADYCYCDYCRTAFKDESGIELVEFPAGSSDARKWLDWKRDRTLRAVRTIAQAIRAARPGIRVTSYVVGPMEMDSKAQGWDLWMKHKLLDGIAVSMYGADIRAAAEKAIQLLDGDTRRLIGAISCDQQPAIYLHNIELTRRYRMAGQYTWHFGDLADDIGGLAAGPYRAPLQTDPGGVRE